MKKTTSLLLFLLLSMLPLAALGQMFKHIEVKDGLPNNQVNSIFKDSDGFMWFGTASSMPGMMDTSLRCSAQRWATLNLFPTIL